MHNKFDIWRFEEWIYQSVEINNKLQIMKNRISFPSSAKSISF